MAAGAVNSLYPVIPGCNEAGASSDTADSQVLHRGRWVKAHHPVDFPVSLNALPELESTPDFGRRRSLLSVLKGYVKLFIAWASGSTTTVQKGYMTRLYDKLSYDPVGEKQRAEILRTGKIPVPLQEDHIRAADSMVRCGLARFCPSELRKGRIIIEFIRPDNNEALEQMASELLARERSIKAVAHAKAVLESEFSVSEEADLECLSHCLVEEATAALVHELVQQPVDIHSFIDAVANFNYWLSISYRLKGKTEMQPDDIADELDQLWGKIKCTLPDDACIDPVLSRAAGFITAMDPGDELIEEGPRPLSHMGLRVKASAPLMIRWFEDKMGREAVRESGSLEECQMIEAALRAL